MNGAVLTREGNRQRGYLQGVYPTAVDGEWVAVSVSDDIGLDQLAFDEAVAKADSIVVPVQVNGKLRAKLDMGADATREQVERLALAQIAEWLQDKELKKVIYVDKKLINFVL